MCPVTVAVGGTRVPVGATREVAPGCESSAEFAVRGNSGVDYISSNAVTVRAINVVTIER